MKTGWIIQIESGDVTLRSVLKMDKGAAEVYAGTLQEPIRGSIISPYTEYGIANRVTKEYVSEDVSELLKSMILVNPILISSKESRHLIDLNNQTEEDK